MMAIIFTPDPFLSVSYINLLSQSISILTMNSFLKKHDFVEKKKHENSIVSLPLRIFEMSNYPVNLIIIRILQKVGEPQKRRLNFLSNRSVLIFFTIGCRDACIWTLKGIF